jgi:hypothetical protein
VANGGWRMVDPVGLRACMFVGERVGHMAVVHL